MAANFSKPTNNLTLPTLRRGQIKINALKLIAKSVRNLAIELAGKTKKTAGNERTNAIKLKSASERKIRPKRGDVKVKIFKSIAKSVKDFAIGVAGEEKNSAGDGGGVGGGCVSAAPASVIPVESVGGLKVELEYEMKQTEEEEEEEGGKIEIDICKVIGSILEFPMESGGKKKVGPWAGIVPMGIESEKGCDYR